MIVSVSGKIGSGKDTVGSIIQYLTTYKSYGYTHPTTEKDFNDFTKNNHFNSWKIVKWADKLKDMVCILLSCTREQLEDRVFKETELGEEWWYWKSNVEALDNIQVLLNTRHPYIGHKHINIKATHYQLIKLTPRLLLQLMGTECGRQIIHPNIWVNATMVDYKPNGTPYNSLGDLYDDLKHCPSQTKNPDWIITDTRFPNEADAVKQRGGINIRLIRNLKKCTCSNDLEYSNCNKNCERHRIETEHVSETALDFYKFDYVVDNNGTIEDLIIKVKEILIKEQII